MSIFHRQPGSQAYGECLTHVRDEVRCDHDKAKPKVRRRVPLVGMNHSSGSLSLCVCLSHASFQSHNPQYWVVVQQDRPR